MRCRRMGATCLKLEPPGRAIPMGALQPAAYAALHEGVEVRTADLKTEAGQRVLQARWRRRDVLLTSFRPRRSVKLGLDWVGAARPPSRSCRRWRSSARPASVPRSPATT